MDGIDNIEPTSQLKAILAWMVVFSIMIVLWMFSSGCGHKPIYKTVTKDSLVTNTIIKDSIIVIPGDNISDTITNPCDSTHIINEYKKHTSASIIVKQQIINGKKDFIINCNCDKYLKTIDSFRIIKNTVNTKSTINTITITKKYIPKIMWYLTIGGILIVLGEALRLYLKFKP